MGRVAQTIVRTAATPAALAVGPLAAGGSAGLLGTAAAAGLGFAASKDIRDTRAAAEDEAIDANNAKVKAEADAANRERIAAYYANFEKERGNQRLGRNSTMSRGILLNDNRGGLLR